MRYRGKVDDNQAALVSDLRRMGLSVEILSGVGKGCPDLLIGMPNRMGFTPIRLNVLVELKDGAKPPSDQKLTPDQVKWHARWKGQVAVANSLDAALDVLGIRREE